MFDAHVVYIAGGFIPSTLANSIQQMKMAQALARQVRHFDLVSGVGPLVWLRFSPTQIRAWYGLTTAFSMRRRVLYPRWWGRTMDGAPRPQPQHAQALARYTVERLKPDLVMTRWGAAADYCLAAGVPTVYEQHEKIDVRGKHVLENLSLYQGSDFRALVTIHDLIAETYTGAGVPEDKILVLHDGADLSAFEPPMSTSQARAAVGLDHVTGPLAVYAGTLREERGADVILQAATQLPEVTFLLLGAWDQDQIRVGAQVEARGWTNILLRGFVPNAHIPAHLQAADALLLPYTERIRTHRWMSPLKLFEYMAAARPIIASDLPAIRDVLNDENALLIPPDDPGALVEALRRVMDDAADVAALAAQARRDVEPYSWEARARAILARAIPPGA